LFLFGFWNGFFTKKGSKMSKNILFYLKEIERNVRNHNHLILSVNLDDSWWFNALDDSAAYKIKANMQNLADKPFITLVVIS
jgi:hypothetical protein